VLGRREAGFDCPDIWHSPTNSQKLYSAGREFTSKATF
jgi:hypothetical protein